jgi:hypothetical protein
LSTSAIFSTSICDYFQSQEIQIVSLCRHGRRGASSLQKHPTPSFPQPPMTAASPESAKSCHPGPSKKPNKHMLLFTQGAPPNPLLSQPPGAPGRRSSTTPRALIRETRNASPLENVWRAGTPIVVYYSSGSHLLLQWQSLVVPMIMFAGGGIATARVTVVFYYRTIPQYYCRRSKSKKKKDFCRKTANPCFEWPSERAR